MTEISPLHNRLQIISELWAKAYSLVPFFVPTSQIQESLTRETLETALQKEKYCLAGSYTRLIQNLNQIGFSHSLEGRLWFYEHGAILLQKEEVDQGREIIVCVNSIKVGDFQVIEPRILSQRVIDTFTNFYPLKLTFEQITNNGKLDIGFDQSHMFPYLALVQQSLWGHIQTYQDFQTGCTSDSLPLIIWRQAEQKTGQTYLARHFLGNSQRTRGYILTVQNYSDFRTPASVKVRGGITLPI